MKHTPLIVALTALSMIVACGRNLAPDTRSFEEVGGVVAVEAEHFHAQTEDDVRRWYVTRENTTGLPTPDPDPSHAGSASGGAYLEILPDTRATHDDTLIHSENFANTAGTMAFLHYNIYFNTPGKYYVWVRAYSTGTEDNGIHVGLNGEWPTNGARMQWCTGKNNWTWESKQRTDQEHCGVPELIFLDIPEAGEHTVMFSMREDGFEFDKFVLTQVYEKPEGEGPAERRRQE